MALALNSLKKSWYAIKQTNQTRKLFRMLLSNIKKST